MIWFLIGVVLGGNIGFLTACILSARKISMLEDDENCTEKYLQRIGFDEIFEDEFIKTAETKPAEISQEDFSKEEYIKWIMQMTSSNHVKH